MVATDAILDLTVLAKGRMNEKITIVFLRITDIMLAGLSAQYFIDGLAATGLITSS